MVMGSASEKTATTTTETISQAIPGARTNSDDFS